MISNFNEEAQNILIKAKLEMLEFKHPYIGTEHLVLAILKSNIELKDRLETYNLTYDNFKREILNIIGKGTKKSEFFLHTPLLKKVIENAVMDSKDNNNGIVTAEHLFSAILEVGEGVAIRIFLGMNLDLDEMYDEFREKAYRKTNVKRKLLIDELGINLNELAKNKQLDPIYGREKEITEIEEILCRKNKNNPLLIGPPGIGKTAIVERLATMIENDEVPQNLKNMHIISIDMATIVAGTKYRGEFEERMKKLLNEIEDDKNIILFIDEVHTLIGAGGAEGAIDASNILKPALARGKIKLIGATTTDEYKKHFETDKALTRRFQIVNINEPSKEETKAILQKIKPTYEKYHNITIDDVTLDELIMMTEKYIYGRFRPDKEIDILDEVCSKVSIRSKQNDVKSSNNLINIRDKKELYIKENDIKKAYKYKIKETKYNSKIKDNNKIKITVNDIASLISNKTKIPTNIILNQNTHTINSLYKKLKENIIGESIAIENIIRYFKRKSKSKTEKVSSILLVGPPGSGKLKTAKIIADTISPDNYLNINLTSYSDNMAINRFIGTSPGLIGYDEHKYLLNNIQNKPGSTIIFENIEEAHPKIIKIIKEILKNNTTKDAKGNNINFNNNTIIIISHKNNKPLGFCKKNHQKDNYLDSIDEIINFEPLKKESIIKIIKQNLTSLENKYSSISIIYTNNVIKDILKECNYQTFGTDKINTIISKIENVIIDNIVENNNKVTIDSLFSK